MFGSALSVFIQSIVIVIVMVVRGLGLGLMMVRGECRMSQVQPVDERT